MNIGFEHDYQKKLMVQTFLEPTLLATAQDITAWRQRWTKELASWHSPYKVLVDCSKLSWQPESPDVLKNLERMVKFFEGLFLRKMAGFGFAQAQGHGGLPFKVCTTFEEAGDEIGLRGARQAQVSDFRSTIQLQNHFAQHVVELGFADHVAIASAEQVDILKSKLTNNLMQWHSKWSLLVDCSKVEFAEAVRPEMEKMLRYLRGFFMKSVVGYSPSKPKDAYPFSVFRARHNAVARLESEGTFLGSDAQCRSKTAKP